MDSKELEDKLEKDNLTLKEHILKLQNTIKNIKTELSNTNNNTTYVNTLSQIDISTIKNSKIESPKNNGKQNIKDDSDEEINSLKFSFKNIKAEQKLLEENKRKRENALNNNNNFIKNKKDEEAISNSKIKTNFDDMHNSNSNKYKYDHEISNNKNNKIKDKNIVGAIVKSHVYKENFSKVKNEKDIIQKMENVRNAANIKKSYAGPDSDEDSEYERFQRLNKLMKNDANNTNKYNNINELVENRNNNNNDFKMHNYDYERNEDVKGYVKRSYDDYDPEAKDDFENNISNKNAYKNLDDVDSKYNCIPKYKNSNNFVLEIYLFFVFIS